MSTENYEVMYGARLSKETAKKLQAIAKNNRTTISRLIRIAVEDWLAKEDSLIHEAYANRDT